MTACPSDTFFERYATGEMPDAEVEAIEAHAEHCLACAERLAGAEVFDQVLSDVQQASQEETHIVAGLKVAQRSGADHGSLVGHVIGDFEVRRMIGSGGMGAVYEAEQISLKRRVALKILHAPMTAKTAGVLRFVREAQAAARLHHTNIVSVFGQGQTNGFRYYAMEMIHGTGLDQIIREMRRLRAQEEARRLRGLPSSATSAPVPRLPETTGWSEFDVRRRLVRLDRIDRRQRFDLAARLVADVADALDYAHRQGVIHRDVKPSNLILSTDGRLSLTDFGLARVLEQPGMTIAGEFLGSPLYMSPEQVAAGRVPIDHRTDIYSLGATLYELLCLEPPFTGETREQIISQIRESRVTRPRRIDPQIPRDLETVCLKAMRPDPVHRYETAGEMAADLRRFIRRFAIHARRASLVDRGAKFLNRHSFEAAMILAVIGVSIGAGVLAWHYQAQTSLAEEGMAAAQTEARNAWLHWVRDSYRKMLDDGHYAVANGEFGLAFRHFTEAVQAVERDPNGPLARDPAAYVARGLTRYLIQLLGFGPGRFSFADDLKSAYALRPESGFLKMLSKLPDPAKASRASKEELAPLIDQFATTSEEAIRELTHSNGALVHIVMAWVAFAGKDLDRAQLFSGKALAAQPNMVAGYFINAIILLARGEFSEARGEAQLAIRLASPRRWSRRRDGAAGHLIRSMALLALGQQEIAQREVDQAMHLIAEPSSRASATTTQVTTRPRSRPGSPASRPGRFTRPGASRQP